MGRSRWLVVAMVLLLVGGAALLTAPTNTRFEGWAMLVRALVGQGCIVFGVECLTRGAEGTKPVRIRRLVLLVSSLLLFPIAALVLLMSKESGSSWGIAALVLLGWYIAAAIYAAITIGRARLPSG